MATPLGFIIWTENVDISPPGQVAGLSDGPKVALMHKAKDFVEKSGKKIAEIEFKMQLESNKQTVAEHNFRMKKMSDFWLIADPAASDENGSFSAKFLSVFVNSPVGKHNYTMKLLGDGNLINIGEFNFYSDGNNPVFKKLLLKFL